MTQEEKEAGFRPVECECCGESIRSEEDLGYADEGTFYADKTICRGCEEGCDCDPEATVYYGRDDYPHPITSVRNETQGDFNVVWHRTDPWRGYYEAKSDRYVRVFTDAILSGHESEAMLKELNGRLLEAFGENGVEYARVFCRSSNVFSTGYETGLAPAYNLGEEGHRADPQSPPHSGQGEA